MKVVINTAPGGFGLSELAVRSMGVTFAESVDMDRHDPRLVQAVESLGTAANGVCANLIIVDVDSPNYTIREFDGIEMISEPDPAYARV